MKRKKIEFLSFLRKIDIFSQKIQKIFGFPVIFKNRKTEKNNIKIVFSLQNQKNPHLCQKKNPKNVDFVNNSNKIRFQSHCGRNGKDNKKRRRHMGAEEERM